jgi:hypothetical protein
MFFACSLHAEGEQQQGGQLFNEGSSGNLVGRKYREDRRSIMITQLSDKESILSRPVHYTVLVVDAPGPVTGKTVFEGFGFAGTCKRIAHDLVYQPVNAFQQIPVGILPVEVVLPGVLGKDQLHSTSRRVLPPPRSSSAIDSRRRLAFFGTRRRYAVSSSALKSSRESITTDSSFCLVMMTGSWFSHTFFIVAASLVRAAEYVIVAISISFLYCTNNCTNRKGLCQGIICFSMKE